MTTLHERNEQTPSLPAERWVEILSKEYLDSFVRDGGAAVKFAVTVEDGTRELLRKRLKAEAKARGYLWAEIDSRKTKVHMLEQVFFAVAEQVPWLDLCEKRLLRMAKEAHFAPPAEGTGSLAGRIALAQPKGNDVSQIVQELRPLIGKAALQRRDLARDFRTAMTELCRAVLISEPGEMATSAAILSWLTGRDHRVSAVKPYSIYNSISRANARFMLQSAVRWISESDHTGLVIWLDINRVPIPKPRGAPADNPLYYSRAAVLDAYEVLREFIDSIDDSMHQLLVVGTGQEFVGSELGGRGMVSYSALQNRLVADVKIRNLANPMGTLVSVSS